MSAPTPPPAYGAREVDPVRAHPHRTATPYPLILRTWNFRWWRSVVGIVIVATGYLLVLPLVLLPVLAVGIAIQGGDVHREFDAALNETKVTPASMLYLNLVIAGFLVVTWLVVRYVHRLRPRWLMSVKPGIRWRFFAACLGLAVVAIVAQLIVGVLLPTDANDMNGHLVQLSGRVVALALVVAFTTPLQAMGEEYAFRGYAMQAFGSLGDAIARHFGAAPRRAEQIAIWIAILASAGVFAAAHGVQNFPLFFDRFAFGLLAGYLVYRTGGLEAGIALHVWNNIVAFGFGIAFGDVQKQLTDTSASWWNIPLTVTQNGVYLLLVLLVARRMGIDHLTRPPADPGVLEVGSAPV